LIGGSYIHIPLISLRFWSLLPYIWCQHHLLSVVKGYHNSTTNHSPFRYELGNTLACISRTVFQGASGLTMSDRLRKEKVKYYRLAYLLVPYARRCVAVSMRRKLLHRCQATARIIAMLHHCGQRCRVATLLHHSATVWWQSQIL